MPTNVAPNPLEAHLGYWLRFVSNHVSSRFEKQLLTRHCSVTEWVALRLLFDGPATHAELIQALGMTKGAVSKIVHRLMQRDLITRQRVKGFGRAQQLALTRKGVNLVPSLAALADENDAHFFQHLVVGQRDALAKTLQELVAYHRLSGPPVD